MLNEKGKWRKQIDPSIIQYCFENAYLKQKFINQFLFKLDESIHK